MRIVKIVAFFFFFLVLLGVSMKLFQPKLFDRFLTDVRTIIDRSSVEKISMKNELVIGLPDRLYSLSPTSYLASDRSRLVNIYETLVRSDANLRLEPGLALSWGIIDDTTYEFELRPDVVFHNAEPLTSKDVKASLEFAKNSLGTQISHLVRSIERVEILDDFRLRILTKNPDPLFLNKLTAVFIIPEDTIDIPVGTGPYRFRNYDQKNGTLELERFQNYWGEKPEYEFVKLLAIPDKLERIQALEDGKVDILVSVPASLLHELADYDVKIVSKPSLEVSFLVFNFSETLPAETLPAENFFLENEVSISSERSEDSSQKNILFQKKAREAISKALDKSKLVEFTNDFISPHDQFVSAGVFGFDPNLPVNTYNLEKARSLMQEIESFVRIPLAIDLPADFEAFGKYVSDQLFDIGFSPTLNYLNNDELQKKILSGNSEMYLFGWRSELGDSHDFLESVALSTGKFNGSHYKNDEVDALISASSKNMNPEARLRDLHRVMDILVHEDIFGVPLFEAQVIYAFSRKLRFEPRLDGFVFAKDITFTF